MSGETQDDGIRRMTDERALLLIGQGAQAYQDGVSLTEGRPQSAVEAEAWTTGYIREHGAHALRMAGLAEVQS